MNRLTVVAVSAVAGLALLAGTAHAKGSVYASAPSYPNSTLAIKAAGKPRAGGVARVTISGSNAPFMANGAPSGVAYQLDAFAQDGRVLPQCPRSFAAELQNEINLGISRIAQGFPEGASGAFDHQVAFRTGPRIRSVVVCAYSRFIDDDAAVSALRFKLRSPTCGCRRH